MIEEQQGKRWRRVGYAALHGRTFSARITAPSPAASSPLVLRAAVMRAGKTLFHTGARTLRIEVRPRSGALPYQASTPPSVSPPGTHPDPGPLPLLPPPTLAAQPIDLTVGSSVTIALPEPLASVAEIEGAVAGADQGLAATVSEGALEVSATQTAAAGRKTLLAHILGCTAGECERHFTLEVPVTVHPLQTVSGPAETLTDPSPDRVTDAKENELQDELIITVGTPEAPGSRAEATTAAEAVGAVVSGGIEGSGIYQLRWGTPQDIAQRTAQLEANPAVSSVGPSTVGLYGPDDAYPVASAFQALYTWPYEQVDATEAWKKTTGSGTTVAILDAGSVYRHEDLNVSQTLGSYRPHFHATHVAGIACAEANDVGMVGMAWGCPIVSAHLGSGTFETEVFNRMREIAALPAVRVANASLGYGLGGCATASTQEVVEAKVKKNARQFAQFLGGPEGKRIVWTFSAGNNCAPGAASPWGAASNLSNVITVAATNSDHSLASFSNYGAGVKVAAPGGINVDARTDGMMSSTITFDTNGECPGFDSCTGGKLGDALGLICRTIPVNCGTYGEDAGTSMAAPVVAGIAALVVSAHPSFSAAEVGACITASAGTGGVGETTGKSPLPDDAYYRYTQHLPFSGELPIANAAAAVECRARATASSYKGSGGGDGWAIALSPSSVYNVFHHDGSLRVACHLQATAEPCWPVRTITGPEGEGFASSGQPGLWLDQSSAHLYVYATRTSDATAGLVCIDTAEGASSEDPFCGFTPLTGVGEASYDGISAVSDMAVVGSRLYAYNYVSGAPVEGSKNKLMCFDVSSQKPCSGQPFALIAGEERDEDIDYPPPAVTQIAGRVIVPMHLEGAEEIACFNANNQSACEGNWPVPTPGYPSRNGAAFAHLTEHGAIDGLCLPSGEDPCFALNGDPLNSPESLKDAVAPTLGWNGPALQRGTRVYIPDGSSNSVQCFDFSSDAECAGYPNPLSGLGLLYTVNPDPERPKCIWVNSDNGEYQIQNFQQDSLAGCE